jgi:hypothetical protein
MIAVASSASLGQDEVAGLSTRVAEDQLRGALRRFPDARREDDDMIDETLGATTRPYSSSIYDTEYSTSASRPHDTGETILSWLAVAAVVFGVVGVVGGTMSSRRRTASSWRARGDRYELTPPHGDKLHPQF